MGPAATIDFMTKVAAATPAGLDQEHVPLIVHNVPQIPDRSTAILEGSDAPFLPMLAGVRMLERSGVDVVAIPCNTAHHWYDRLARSCAARIIHIADAVGDAIDAIASTARPVRRVALLATRGTLRAGIYQRRLGDAVGFAIPDEAVQGDIDHAILAVKAGRPADARATLDRAATAMLEGGADALLLACTELPVALGELPCGAVAIDATGALARACVAASLEAAPDLPDLHLGKTVPWTSAGSRTF